MSGGQGHLVNVAQPFKIKMSFKRSVTVARVKGLLRLGSEEVRKGNRHLQAVVRENTGTPACYIPHTCKMTTELGEAVPTDSPGQVANATHLSPPSKCLPSPKILDQNDRKVGETEPSVCALNTSTARGGL